MKENKFLKLIFPYFSNPIESRFVNFFNQISITQLRKSNQKKMEIIPYNIINNLDLRTSILIKNIPQCLKKETVIDLFYNNKKIDYIYIPFNECNNRLLGFIFINVIKPIYILDIINILENCKSNFLFKSNKSCEICYSNLQGKNSFIKAFGPGF
jgi:RNA recognition motif-containing protein